MHPEAQRVVKAMLAELRPRSIYEIGSMNVNGSARTLCPPSVRRYFGIDTHRGRDVDAVGNGATYVPPFRPDLVLCMEVLEHTTDAAAICAQAHAVLKPGGQLIVTTASSGRCPHSPVDGNRVRPGEFYRPVDPSMLRAWMTAAGFAEVDTREGATVRFGAVNTHQDTYGLGHKAGGTTARRRRPPAPLDEPETRIRRTMDTHGAAINALHWAFYEADHTWQALSVLGTPTLKCPTDLWMYQELFAQYRFRTVIETGTYQGGSARWFAVLMDALQIDGRIWTMDIDDFRTCHHPKITFLRGDCTDPRLVKKVTAAMPDDGPRLVVLDAGPSSDHVYRELELYAPLTRPGDWLVVEHVGLHWAPDGDTGPRGAMERYLLAHPGIFRASKWCERFLLTFHPDGWLKRVEE